MRTTLSADARRMKKIASPLDGDRKPENHLKHLQTQCSHKWSIFGGGCEDQSAARQISDNKLCLFKAFGHQF